MANESWPLADQFMGPTAGWTRSAGEKAPAMGLAANAARIKALWLIFMVTLDNWAAVSIYICVTGSQKARKVMECDGMVLATVLGVPVLMMSTVQDRIDAVTMHVPAVTTG